MNDRSEQLPAAEARALRQMVDDLRAEPVPRMDWSAMERRIDATIAAREKAPLPRTSPAPAGGLARAFSFAAAAGVIAIGLGLAGQAPLPSVRAPQAELRRVDPSTLPFAPGEAGARGDLDLTALRPGDALEAGDAPLTFAHIAVGRHPQAPREVLLRWSLAPHGRITVRAAAARAHVVALERGSIHAEVTPRDPAEGLVESFAVEVEGTRVAVHGTAFRVTRVEDQVVVDVEHGTVAVGPVSHVGITTGRILVGPSRASFSLDGGRTARRLPRELVLAEAESEAPSKRADAPGVALLLDPATDPAQSPDDAPAMGHAPDPTSPVPAALLGSSAGPSQQASPTAAPSIREPSGGSALPSPAALGYLTPVNLRAGLASCFAQTYGNGRSSSLELRVTSTFTINVRADGTIQSARLDPPLKPEFQTCAGRLIAGRFERGPDVITLPLSFQP